MTKKKGSEVLKEKLPELRSPLKTAAIIGASSIIFTGFLSFFWWCDSLVWFGPLISQAAAAWGCLAVIWGGLPNFGTIVRRYRSKYGKLAYRNFFFRYLIFTYVTWMACVFHPLLIEGPSLLPSWFAVPFAAFLILFHFLLQRPAISGGFSLAHLYSVYLVFPEEGTRVNSGIFSYLRHPSYASNLYLSLGLALLKNNLLAVLTVPILAILTLVAIRLEEKELVERFGDKHKRYINETPAFFPHLNNLGSFAKLILLGKD